MKAAKPGLGSRLESRFSPSLFWGAEFLADKVRLCALKLKDGKVTPVHTFEGEYAEAEAFAAMHKLDQVGFHAAISHLPFKVQSMGHAAEGGEEDIVPHAESMRPQGLPLDAFDMQTFSQGGEKHLVMAREEVVRGFLDSLPPVFSGMESLDAGPLALLTALESAATDEIGNLTFMRGWTAAVLAEADFSHLLFFESGTLKAYAKVFQGWEQAGLQPELFTKDMKKALVYYFGSRYPDAQISALQIWRDGPGGEVAAGLIPLGIPAVTPRWSAKLNGVTDLFRVAGAMALYDMPDASMPMSFSIPHPSQVESRRLWRHRAGALAKTGFHIMAGAGIGVVLLVLSALALRYTVEVKARTWSGELGKWDQYQKRKAAVEAQVGGMRDLLARRTQGYADMQNIAACLPSELWMESWEMEAGPGRGLVHRLTGLSLAEGRIPEFLAKLEQAKALGVVKLKSTERIKGEVVEEKTHIKANHKDLVRFQIGISE